MSDGTVFTERELDVMSVLWREGSGTVAEVREGLSVSLGYTSVLKMLQILEEKGMVRHEAEGREDNQEQDEQHFGHGWNAGLSDGSCGAG